MKILFDQGVPVPLKNYLVPKHEVATAYELGLSEISNGKLLKKAIELGFEIIISTDQNLNYQQNLKEYDISTLVLLSTSWPKIKNKVEVIVEVINDLGIKNYKEIEI